jgi:hypothetical protein
MEKEDSDNQKRFLCSETIWFKDVAHVVKKEFGPQGNLKFFSIFYFKKL